MKRASKNTVKKELELGAKYAYVCTTVYPDIEGKVLIDGKPFYARSSRTFYRGDVVLCRRPVNGVAEIPVLVN